jgi:hypothetical protein
MLQFIRKLVLEQIARLWNASSGLFPPSRVAAPVSGPPVRLPPRSLLDEKIPRRILSTATQPALKHSFNTSI